MKTIFVLPLLALALSPVAAFANVVVSSPSNGAIVPIIVPFSATAGTSSCVQGVAAMGIYIDDQLSFVSNGTNLHTSLPLTAGPHRAAVQEWDYCGGASKTILQLTVGNPASTVISVTSPVNRSTVPPLTAFVASATSSCPQGVAAMGVYINNVLTYVAQGANLNTQITLTPGAQNAVVQEWDNCGGSTTAPVNVTVTGTKPATKLSNLQSTGGWNQWGELNPIYDICSPCEGVSWSMNQHVASPSLSGNATKFTMSGTTPYSDVLWSNPVIGQGTTLGMPDTNQTLLPTVHHMTYDADVFVTDFAVTQDLEFDVNLYMGGVGMEWGTECNHLDHKVWDYWDNVNATWVPTTIPCVLNDKGWNHVSFDVSRGSNNDLTYNSLTVNGTTYQINKTVPPFPVPAGWYGMTVNYQMDGNYNQATNTTYVDNLNITYQ